MVSLSVKMNHLPALLASLLHSSVFIPADANGLCLTETLWHSSSIRFFPWRHASRSTAVPDAACVIEKARDYATRVDGERRRECGARRSFAVGSGGIRSYTSSLCRKCESQFAWPLHREARLGYRRSIA